MIGKWEPKGVALEAVQDLINFLKGFTEFAHPLCDLYPAILDHRWHSAVSYLHWRTRTLPQNARQ